MNVKPRAQGRAGPRGELSPGHILHRVSAQGTQGTQAQALCSEEQAPACELLCLALRINIKLKACQL